MVKKAVTKKAVSKPVKKVNNVKETKTINYFTFYGFNEKTKKIERLTTEQCNAIYQTSNKQQERINLIKEAKELLTTHKQNIYFEKQEYKAKKYGYCSLKKEVKVANAKLKDMKNFVFGYDMDIEKARQLFESMPKEEAIQKSKSATSTKKNPSTAGEKKQVNIPTKDSALFTLANKWLMTKRETDTLGKRMEFIKNVLLTVDNGRVLSNGKTFYSVLIGVNHGWDTADVEKLKKDGLFEQFSKETKPKVTLSVDDGIALEREKKITATADQFNENQLYDMADEYFASQPYLEQKQKELEQYRSVLLRDCGEGSTRVKMGDKELVVNIKTAESGSKIVDVDALKNVPALWEKYKKVTADIKFLHVKKLV